MILALLQARFSSTRLPGKVLMPILNVPMLLRQIERTRRSNTIDMLVVATSTDANDNAIYELCYENGMFCFRGSLDNVLDRFYQAAKIYNPDNIVRLTGDCPLTDPQLIDHVVEFHLKGNYDYTSNVLEPTYPDGLDIEVFKLECLESAWREAELPSQREHVTPFIYSQPDRFKIGSYKNDVDQSHLRWTVDEPLDFKLITKIYESLYPCSPVFSTEDILSFLEKHPDLKDYNTVYKRNEGLEKSLVEDIKYFKSLQDKKV